MLLSWLSELRDAAKGNHPETEPLNKAQKKSVFLNGSVTAGYDYDIIGNKTAINQAGLAAGVLSHGGLQPGCEARPRLQTDSPIFSMKCMNQKLKYLALPAFFPPIILLTYVIITFSVQLLKLMLT